MTMEQDNNDPYADPYVAWASQPLAVVPGQDPVALPPPVPPPEPFPNRHVPVPPADPNTIDYGSKQDAGGYTNPIQAEHDAWDWRRAGFPDPNKKMPALPFGKHPLLVGQGVNPYAELPAVNGPPGDEVEQPGQPEESDAYLAAMRHPTLGHEDLGHRPTTVADLVGQVHVDPQTGQPVAVPGSYEDVMAAQSDASSGEPLPSAGDKAAADVTNRAVANMTPEQFVKYKTDRDSAMLAKQAELEAKANAEDMRRAQQDRDMQIAAANQALAKTQALDADSSRLAAQHINPDRYRENRGVFGTIRDVVGSLLLGLGGRPDLAMNQINQRVNDDIAAQKDDMANAWKGIDLRRNSIATEYATHGDIYHAQETYRIAALKAAASDLQTQMQQFDPNGSTAIRGRDALDQFHGQIAQAMQAYTTQQQKATYDGMKAQSEYAEKMAAAEKSAAEAAQIRAKMANAGAGAGAGGANPALLSASYPGLPQPPKEWFVGKTQQQAEKEYTGWLERNNKGQELLAKQREIPERALDGMPLGVDKNNNVIRGPITQADGKVFIPRTEEQAKALQKQKPYVNDVNRLTNQMARDIADLGMLDKSSALATEKHQRLVADKEAVIFALHGAEKIEGFRPGTAEMLEKLLGGVDPFKWGRDATTGILRARDNINADFTEQMRGAGYDGPDYRPADTSNLDKPQETANEAAVHQLVDNPIGHQNKEGHAIITPDVIANIQRLKAASEAGDKTAGDALVRIAKDAPREVRLYAQYALQQSADDAVGSAVGSEGADSDYAGQSTTHETLPPEPKKAEPAKLYPHPRGTAR